MMNVDEQIKIITKGVSEIIGIDELKEKLIKVNTEGRALTVKLGLDPSAPDIHLGHTVVLRKIKQLQDLGHKAVIIIGDFTGRIGDPTGKSKTRKALTDEEVQENAETYKEQIFKILDAEKTEIMFNSEWLSKLTFSDVIDLSSKYTVARMMEREDFKKRFEGHESIALHEFFYPLMQGYDSVHLKADIEIGATEQKFNILMGRFLQKEYGQESQIALFMPILEGLDGIEKMSKSLGNYVGINESSEAMYEKIMTIPDNLIVKYFELVTDKHPDEIQRIEGQLNSNLVNPRDIKMQLAREITSLYHNEEESLKAEERFKLIFQKREIPEDIPCYEIIDEALTDGKIDILKVLVTADMVSSKSDARRLIIQKALKINGKLVEDFKNVILGDGDIIQLGKKNFVKVKIK